MCLENEVFERKPVTKAILELALPSVAGQIILVIYNMADTFFVAMTESDAMITAVSICMPVLMFLSAIANLFGVGGASVIARALGANKEKQAEKASSFSVWVGGMSTSLYLILCLAASDFIVNAIGGSDPVVHMLAKRYLLIAVVIGGLATVMSNLLSHLLRAVGASLQAGIGIAMGGILNILLDPLFMFVLFPKGNEVAGAAAATAVSNAAALLYFVIYLSRNRRKNVISVGLCRGMFSREIVAEVIGAGLPACLMTLFENLSFAFLNRLTANVGTTAQAGIGVAKKINMLAHSIVRGLTQGVLPLMAYNYASGNQKRMKKVLRQTIIISVSAAFVCMGFCLAFGRQLTGIFIRYEGESADYGILFLKILCFGAPFSACGYTFITFFQAVGKGYRAALLALTRKGMLDIPLMAILAHVWPIIGPVQATPITDIACCIIGIALYIGFIQKLKKKKGDPSFEAIRRQSDESSLRRMLK